MKQNIRLFAVGNAYTNKLSMPLKKLAHLMQITSNYFFYYFNPF